MKKIVKFTSIALAFATVLFLIQFTVISPLNADAASIKAGSDAAQIRVVQTKLKNWGYYTGQVDGIYGSKTVAAVKSFQRKYGLSVDGIVGPQTAKYMGITLSGSSSGSSGSGTGGYSANDVYLLAKCIYAEARGESYVGKVAVGAVILNRVKSPNFPNTISGVIYQPYAFTAVSDGQINLTPDETCKKAAQDAINGWDPSYGSLYYYNPRVATSSWIFSRQVVVTIGNHVFAI